MLRLSTLSSATLEARSDSSRKILLGYKLLYIVLYTVLHCQSSNGRRQLNDVEDEIVKYLLFAPDIMCKRRSLPILRAVYMIRKSSEPLFVGLFKL